jgi:hypothetical protein
MSRRFFPKIQLFGAMFIEFETVINVSKSLLFFLRNLLICILNIGFYAAFQALMPKRCNVLLEAVKELPPLLY